MMLPFTVEQFLDVFAAYNQAIWPMQLILVLFAWAAIFLALKPSLFSNRMIPVLLACLWLWMGVAYHLAFFSRINQGAYVFGALCIVQAVLFLFAGMTGRDMAFRARWNAVSIVGGVFIVYALLIYPALGYVLDHRYPHSPNKEMPCPLIVTRNLARC